jgi:hypothetical protein
MIGRFDINLDDLQKLRHVERELVIGDKPVGIIMIRIFDPEVSKERGVTVNGYSSLDGYPELVLYEGHYREVDGEAMDIKLEKK